MSIEITTAVPADVPQIKELWRLSFTESEGFEDFFINEIFEPAHCFVARDNGRVIGMLNIIPFEISVYNNLLPLGYLYGICTHPDHRRQGIAAKLIDMALFQMHLMNIPISVLIPQNHGLFAYYERFGFSPLLRCNKTQIKLMQQNKTKEVRTATTHDIDHLNTVYTQNMEAVYALRPKKHWRTLLNMFNKYNGGALITTNGYVFYSYNKGKLELNEVIGEGSAQEALLFLNENDAIATTPANSQDFQPLGELRIVKAKTVVELMKEQAKSFEVELTDHYCPWNNGVYKIGNPKQKQTLNQSDFNKLIFGDTNVYFNLGL